MRHSRTLNPAQGCGHAVVVDVGWVSGLAAVRNLARAGVDAHAVDYRRSAIGLRSRMGTPHLSPEWNVDSVGFVAYLIELGRTFDSPATVLPTNDGALAVLARHRDVLGEHFLLPFPSWDVLERIQDKRSQYEAAVRVGVSIPYTAYPATADEAVAAASAAGWPVMLKPLDNVPFKARFGLQGYRCDDEESLRSVFGNVAEYQPILQSFIAGGDDELYTVGTYISPDGRVLGRFSGRKLVQYPPGIGTCRVGEARWLPDLAGQAADLLRELGYHGISQVEFKRDPRDGSYRLIEVNPRLWQWHGLAASCGVNLPWIAHADMQGIPVEPVDMVRDGRRWAIGLLPRSRPIVLGPGRDAILSWRDPRPGAVHIARVVRGSMRRSRPAS